MTSVGLLEPSYLMNGDECGKTAVVAVFAVGTGHKEVPLSNTKFTEVGGEQIGGPKLVHFNIHHLDSGVVQSIYPETNLKAGPYAWCVLQPAPAGSDMQKLRLLVNGATEGVAFVPLIGGTHVEPKLSTTILNDGSIYSDLDTGLLNVTYITSGSPVEETPPAKRGEDTGGVFSGDILSYNTILLGREPRKWTTTEQVRTTKGLPVVVYGHIEAPMLAVWREQGPPDLYKLISPLQ
jgi:hypothetical protein